MKIVARDAKDSLQHLVQIKGGEKGLPRVVKNRNFCHSKGILSSGTALTEVPKVTTFLGGTIMPFSLLSHLFPPSNGADQTVGNQTEPEIQDHSQIQPKGMGTSHGWEGRRHQEINHIP